MSRTKTFFIIICIIVLSIFLAWFLNYTKPVSVKRPPTVVSPLVHIQVLERQNAEIYIEALGTVEASQKTTVRARVSGQVERLGINSDVGKTLKAGELLVQLDDAMYQSVLASKESALLQAMASYDLEIGQQNVAKAEIAQLSNLSNVIESVSRTKDTATDLALRKPQLQQAKAGVDAAKVAVEMAELDVSYAEITAPYNALIINRNISIGSQAGTSDSLFEIVGTDEYRIRAAVPLDKISALDLDEGNREVKIISSTGIEREGFVEHNIASLDTETRLGRVLITIEDPLGLQNSKPALILGDQVIANLSLGVFKDVFVIPRNALYGEDTVFIAVKQGKASQSPKQRPEQRQAKQNPENSTEITPKKELEDVYVLDIRPVEVAYRDINFAYVTSGIGQGDLLITSILPAPIDGMTIRIDKIME